MFVKRVMLSPQATRSRNPSVKKETRYARKSAKMQLSGVSSPSSPNRITVRSIDSTHMRVVDDRKSLSSQGRNTANFLDSGPSEMQLYMDGINRLKKRLGYKFDRDSANSSNADLEEHSSGHYRTVVQQRVDSLKRSNTNLAAEFEKDKAPSPIFLTQTDNRAATNLDLSQDTENIAKLMSKSRVDNTDLMNPFLSPETEIHEQKTEARIGEDLDPNLPTDYEERNLSTVMDRNFASKRLSSDPSNFASVRTCQMFNDYSSE